MSDQRDFRSEIEAGCTFVLSSPNSRLYYACPLPRPMRFARLLCMPALGGAGEPPWRDRGGLERCVLRSWRGNILLLDHGEGRHDKRRGRRRAKMKDEVLQGPHSANVSEH
jgi:hypothetical protein